MSSVPVSRYLFYPVTWYSFLIVTGAVFAIILSCRRERQAGLPKDTVIDLSLWIFPFGILGARIYYVVFSWNQFRSDPISFFRIWEGGLAIYGGIIAGVIVLFLFARRRALSPLLLCDVIVPGLSLAQCIGRWGNWFNMEAYGLAVSNKALCFFPFAVLIPSDNSTWHLATFFYESVWDFLIFLFLIRSGKKTLQHRGDSFFFYLFLYAAGRLVIEELRLDSLYASSVRISQLLSILICIYILMHYVILSRKKHTLVPSVTFFLLPLSTAVSSFILFYTLSSSLFSSWPHRTRIILLSVFSLLMLISLFAVYIPFSYRGDANADN